MATYICINIDSANGLMPGDLSTVKFSNIHLKAISQAILQPLIVNLNWKLLILHFDDRANTLCHPNLPRANKLSLNLYVFAAVCQDQHCSECYAPDVCKFCENDYFELGGVCQRMCPIVLTKSFLAWAKQSHHFKSPCFEIRLRHRNSK